MYRLMQPSEEAAVVALWQAERGDSAAFAKTALEQFAGVENVYVAEENGRLEAAALAVPVTLRGRSGSYLYGLCGKGELLLAGLVDYLCGFVLFFKLRMNARIDGKNKKQTAKAEPAALGTETKEEQN